MEQKRCDWVTNNPLMIEYHDQEWGRMDRFEDDHYLFEMLILEGAQAGLSWFTILKRRQAYREAFCQFNPQRVAAFKEEDLTELMNHSAIIRHERKVRSAVTNARAFLKVQEVFGSFHTYLWEFVGKKQIISKWEKSSDTPASSPLSHALTKDLKRRGFSFVGPVICYSYLQAVGLIKDHIACCFLSL